MLLRLKGERAPSEDVLAAQAKDGSFVVKLRSYYFVYSAMFNEQYEYEFNEKNIILPFGATMGAHRLFLRGRISPRST